MTSVSRWSHSLQGHLPAHDFGLFMCHQSVCGLVPCPSSLFWPLCVSSACTWFRSFQPCIPAHDFGLVVPSACTWSHSLKHMLELTILGSSCAISLYVVSFFKAHIPAHDFGLFVYHWYVCGLLLSSTHSGSRFHIRMSKRSTPHT